MRSPPASTSKTFATTSVAGTATINLTGNELAQRIDGNNGVNVMNGGGGNDLLLGIWRQ